RAGYRDFRPGRTYEDLATQWLATLLRTKVTSPNFRASCIGVECPEPTQSISAAQAHILGFNAGTWAGECDPLPIPCSCDTAHYNRWPMLLRQAHDAGIIVTTSDLQHVANLFTSTIWNGSTTTPQFRNRTDGNNQTYRRLRGPWVSGQIVDGF